MNRIYTTKPGWMTERWATWENEVELSSKVKI